MKNLELVSAESVQVDQVINPALCCYWMDKLFLVTDFNLHVFEALQLRHEKTLELKPPDQSLAVYLDVCLVTDRIVICFSNGDLLAVDFGGTDVEYVGCIDPGIEAACWSPGGDLLAIVTSSKNLVLLSHELDPISEVELRNAGGGQQVSVGWGKRETQFRGSEGKFSNQKDSKEKIPVEKYDDGKARVSWRGDGQFLVVSYLENDVRNLKVVGHDGVLLHSCPEPVVGLECALSWRPNGSLIASSQRLPNKQIICFFEKNLLPHGEFIVDKECTIHEVMWNVDSSILAVVLTENSHWMVKLFSSSNYHWYHKFTVTPFSSENAVSVFWDREDALLLHLITANSNTYLKHSRFNFRWTFHASSGASIDDQGLVAVIDGNRVLVTAFRQAIIPPPMSSYSIVMEQPVNSIGFLQYGAESAEISSNDLFVSTIDNTLAVFNYDASEKCHKQVMKKHIEDLVTFQLSWVGRDCLIGCALNSKSKLSLIKIGLTELEESLKEKPLSLPFVSTRRIPETQECCLWFKNQTISEINLDTLDINDSKMASPRSGKILAIEVRKQSFLLDSACVLYVDQEPFVKSVNAFRLTPEHLLVTTLQHKLIIWQLSSLNTPGYERDVERGSKIVSNVPYSSSVVLQLPRGNLEVIQPRALVLAKLKVLMDSCNYRESYAIMRRERINLNLLYDHDPECFKQHVGLFIDQVKDPNYLSTLIADLTPENVTQMHYAQFYPCKEHGDENKLDVVCSLLLMEFDNRQDKEKWLLPILSCLIKNGKTEGALLRVQELLTGERRGVSKAVTSADGLTHILYLVDIEELFRIALGTYDLSLVTFIASKAQKDPKEYLPFLSSLHQLEANYQKFTIDNFLKRYEKALSHLAKCPDRMAECLEFVVKRDLYKVALKIFEVDTDTWKRICVLYGENLTRLGRHEEAGYLLQRAEQWTLAQNAFGRAGAWRMQILCADSSRMSESDMKDLLVSIADNLMTSRRYQDAAVLFLDYLRDVETAVDALCNAQLYQEALRILSLHGLKGLLDSKLRPHVVKVGRDYQQLCAESKQSYDTCFARLGEVRNERSSGDFMDWDDTASESSRSSSNRSSRASSRATRNTRKLERNLMKKGGPFEEVALVAALHDLITKLVGLKSTIREINVILVHVCRQDEAEALQKVYGTTLDYVLNQMKSIWDTNQGETEKQSTSNSIAAAFRALPSKPLPGPVQALQPKFLFPPETRGAVEWQLEMLKE